MADSNLFSFENHSLHTETIDGEPLFLAKDLCAALGFTNPWKAVADHVDPCDLTKREVTSEERHAGTKARKSQLMTWVNESGMYALIFGSKLPSAIRFKRWVTSEVLPVLRRKGSYSVAEAGMRPAPVFAGPFRQKALPVPSFEGIPPVLRDLEDLVRGISGESYAVTEAFHRSFSRGLEAMDSNFERDNVDVLRIFRSDDGKVLFELDGIARILGVDRLDPAFDNAPCDGIRITARLSDRFDLPFNLGIWMLCDPANAVFLARLGAGPGAEDAKAWLFNSVFPAFGLSYARALREIGRIRALE